MTSVYGSCASGTADTHVHVSNQRAIALARAIPPGESQARPMFSRDLANKAGSLRRDLCPAGITRSGGGRDRDGARVEIPKPTVSDGISEVVVDDQLLTLGTEHRFSELPGSAHDLLIVSFEMTGRAHPFSTNGYHGEHRFHRKDCHAE